MTTRQIRGGALSAVALVCALSVSASLVRAQSALPTGWASREIGSTGIDGSTTFSSGTWAITGGGANIWGTSDEFRFAYRQITGDVDIRVRLASFRDLEQFSKAGVMIRETLYANSRNAFMLLRADQALFLQWRPKTGESTDADWEDVFPEAAPVWLRLVRRGSQFTGYFSADGTSWRTAGTATINMAATAYVGLAVTSRMDSELSRATFTNLQVSAGLSTATLPAPWTSRDLGSPALAGSASAAGGTFTVAAGGIDIWGTSDQFHFVYQPLQGDVEVIARVASLHDVDPFSKAGVMIRETLTRGSRHASMVATGMEGWAFPRRRATGGTSDGSPYRAGAAPGWVRIVREGNLFSGYTSTNGTTWSLVDTDTIAMASTVYVGLAVTSHDPGARATATFTNVTARRLTTGTNQPPTVSITSPSVGARFNAPASITVTATARDTDGTIAKVAFYRGSTLLGSDTSGSLNGYTYTWTNVAAGSYQLKAVATDNDGDTTESAAVSVTVNSPTNQAPTVSLTRPAPSSTFTAPTSITLAARASDTDGTIAKVDFYRGSTLLAPDTSRNSQNEYTYTWTNVGAGSYDVTAVARDNDGATARSSVVRITVTSVAAPRPTRVAFTASANHATSVSSYTVAIYRGVDNPATASPVGTDPIGKPTPVSGEITVDITTLVNSLSAGTYKVVVRALGPGGTSASAPSPTFTK